MVMKVQLGDPTFEIKDVIKYLLKKHKILNQSPNS